MLIKQNKQPHTKNRDVISFPFFYSNLLRNLFWISYTIINQFLQYHIIFIQSIWSNSKKLYNTWRGWWKEINILFYETHIVMSDYFNENKISIHIVMKPSINDTHFGHALIR
jgi:hypothetical protein